MQTDTPEGSQDKATNDKKEEKADKKSDKKVKVVAWNFRAHHTCKKRRLDFSLREHEGEVKAW